MTDEQIVKALECCMAGGLCHECPCYGGACVVGGGYALALIQRQKDENDRLIELNSMLTEAGQSWEQRYKTARADADYWKAETKTARSEIDDAVREARADAVREFAERLKAMHINGRTFVTFDDVDYVLREMTEGEQ